MNRRKAIGRIILAGIGGTLAFSGYKWYGVSKTPDIPWLEQHKELLASLAETIIPQTDDSPGARAAGAHDFMLVLLKDCTDRHTLNKFIDGCKDLESHCQSRYNTSFDRCTEADRIAILTALEKKDHPTNSLWSRAENRYLGTPFFTTLKKYTVTAYCTSQPGATQGLAYVPVPVNYQGCTQMLPGQRAWATK
jgi:hypothetical protein